MVLSVKMGKKQINRIIFLKRSAKISTGVKMKVKILYNILQSLNLKINTYRRKKIMAYAKRLTKEQIEAAGFTKITEDGRVFKGDKEYSPMTNKNGYLVIPIYDLDENEERIKIPCRRIPKDCKREIDTYFYKTRTIGLHRAMWAWHYGEVPEGLVVDHVNNQHRDISDYTLDNFQLLTPGENINKEKPHNNTKELKCQLDKPRGFYQDKLEKYLLAYEEAKREHNAEAARRLRANISQTRARLRYYDSHLLEAINLNKTKEDYEAAEKARKQDNRERAKKVKELKADIERAHKFYKELREAYGKDDPIVYQYWGEWKLAIAMYQGFCAKNPTKRLEIG